jgi:hypothetical protein
VRRCQDCHRHLHHETNVCPFCGTHDRVTHWAPLVGVVVGLAPLFALAGCGDDVGTQTDAAGTGQATTAGATTGSETTASATATGTQTTTTAEGTGSTSDPDSDSSASTGSGDATTLGATDTDATGSTETTGSTGIDDTTSTTDDSMDTAMPPYAGAYPEPDDEAQASPESTTGTPGP